MLASVGAQHSTPDQGKVQGGDEGEGEGEGEGLVSGQGDTAHLAAALAACPLEHALSRGSGAYAHRMLRGEIARAAHCRCRAVLALPPLVHRDG